MASVFELGLVGAVPTRPALGSFHLYVLSTDSNRYLQTSTAEINLANLGDMTQAVYDAAGVSEQLVGLTASQALTTKSVNGVTLTDAGSATNFLNEAGDYVSIGAINDFYQAYDSAGVTNPNSVTPVAIPFATTEQGQSWITDTSATLKTINTTGVYAISFVINIEKTTANSATLQFDLSVNGVLTGFFDVFGEVTGNDHASYQGVGRVRSLTATDTLEIEGFRIKGNSNTITTIADNTRLTIFRLS